MSHTRLLIVERYSEVSAIRKDVPMPKSLAYEMIKSLSLPQVTCGMKFRID
jgi:hypothetical protein